MNKDLLYKKETVYKKLGTETVDAAFAYAEGYKSFLDNGKTERESVDAAIALVSAHGYREYTLGDTVKAGDILMILEAMKMENEIMAPSDGTVSSVNVTSGASVEGGTVLCSLS